MFQHQERGAPKRLGVTGPVRYPQGMPPQMYPPGYMTNQPYPGMPPNPQYGGNYYGNYGPPGPGYRQWRPGMPPGQVPPPQNPLGMMPNSQMQQSLRMQQSPGMQQQSPRMQAAKPRHASKSWKHSAEPHQQTSLGVLQNPHMQQSPGHHHSPGTQQSPGMVQSPVGNFSPQGAAGWIKHRTTAHQILLPLSVFMALKNHNSQPVLLVPRLLEFLQLPVSTKITLPMHMVIIRQFQMLQQPLMQVALYSLAMVLE